MDEIFIIVAYYKHDQDAFPVVVGYVYMEQEAIDITKEKNDDVMSNYSYDYDLITKLK
jgi:hypothetical protein